LLELLEAQNFLKSKVQNNIIKGVYTPYANSSLLAQLMVMLENLKLITSIHVTKKLWSIICKLRILGPNSARNFYQNSGRTWPDLQFWSRGLL